MKKVMIVALSAVLLAGGGFAAYNGLFRAKEVSVSKIKAKPEEYLGKVVISGKAGRVYADKGLVEMVDEKACCNLFLALPMNEAQQKELDVKERYEGRLPAQGEAIFADGELVRNPDGFTVRVEEVRTAGGSILRKI